MSWAWELPVSAMIGGRQYAIHGDFRDILQIFSYLDDPDLPEYLQWRIALALFYEGEIPPEHQQEAIEFLARFINGGREDTGRPGPKLIDWQQDAQTVVADVNKVAGQEIRAMPFLHWWTFLSYFYGIGEGQLSTVISIRSKKSSGKKLEKWEESYYKKNKHKINFQKPKTQEDTAAQEYFNKWLGGGNT